MKRSLENTQNEDIQFHNHLIANELLFCGVTSNDPNKILWALQRGADIDARNSAGLCALHLAALKPESLELLEFLITHSGIRIDVRDFEGKTPMHWAALTANTAAIELLLRAGANANAVCTHNRTPLATAASLGFIVPAAILLEQPSVRQNQTLGSQLAIADNALLKAAIEAKAHALIAELMNYPEVQNELSPEMIATLHTPAYLPSVGHLLQRGQPVNRRAQTETASVQRRVSDAQPSTSLSNATYRKQ